MWPGKNVIANINHIVRFIVWNWDKDIWIKYSEKRVQKEKIIQELNEYSYLDSGYIVQL